MKKSTISIRVPSEYKKVLQDICRSKNITLSDYCVTKLNPTTNVAPVNATVLQKFKEGGLLSEQTEMPIELSKTLGLIGGLTTGGFVYFGFKNMLKNNSIPGVVDTSNWSEEKIQLISITSAIILGGLSGIGIHKLSDSLGVNNK